MARGPALGDAVGLHAFDRSFDASDRIVVVDDILSTAALDEAYRFCLESAIFFEAKDGYAGAYMEHGFASPLLLRIVEELRVAMPQTLGDLELSQAWAYAYAGDDERLGAATGDDSCSAAGINDHCDPAAFNINLWLTPDEANLHALDPSLPHGGLVVFPVRPPEDSSYQDFNSFNSEKPGDFVARPDVAARAVSVPYKRNRAVIFDSDFVHRSEAHSFKPGHESRRINLTLLFGKSERLKKRALRARPPDVDDDDSTPSAVLPSPPAKTNERGGKKSKTGSKKDKSEL